MRVLSRVNLKCGLYPAQDAAYLRSGRTALTITARKQGFDMAKAFADRPRWQRWGIIGGWGFLALVVWSIVFPPDPRPEATSLDGPADVAAFRSEFDRLAAPCDAAQMAVGKGLETMVGGDPVALARDARRMEDACKSAWMAVGDLPEPVGLTSTQEDALEALRKDCKEAFYSRGYLAEQLMPVIDGDIRPSKMAEIQDFMGIMQRDSMRCAAAVVAFDPPSPSPAPSILPE